MPRARDPRTIAAANGVGSDTAFGAVTPPLHLSTTYLFDGFKGEGRYAYSRTANPTRDQLADTLAKLEGGAGAVVTSSGMAAVDLVLSQVKPGRLVVAPHDCYGGTYRLLAARADRSQFEIAFVDQSDPAAMGEALGRSPALLLIETPSNPLMRVVDVRTLSSQAKAAGAKVAVDNTFLSPALQQPLSLGADYVIHSTTKYLNGHSDVVGGAVVGRDAALGQRLRFLQNAIGAVPSPLDAFLVLRGIKTLALRMERHQANALTLARWLAARPDVEEVIYPGLPSHPQHDLARRQMSGYGGMLAVRVRGGLERARAILRAVRVFACAESLGGVESLIEHPALMTHASLPAGQRRALGITDDLLRLSVGIEHVEDLRADLEQASDASAGTSE